MRRILPALSVLVAATLLFGMEPMVGRMTLASYGGSAQAWNTCLMTFQGLLFLGYAYAHLVAPRIGSWHVLVVGLSLLALPLGYAAVGESADRFLGVPGSFAGLAATIVVGAGVPFVVLATTTVVVQSWVQASPRASSTSPYPLYAVSNAGSLVALLAYPLVVEPLLGLARQRLLWAVAYGAYAALLLGCCAVLRPARGAARAGRVVWRQAGLWFGLAALPSALLLATTNVLAAEVGSFPLMWVLPLVAYLASFIVAFAGAGTARRGRWSALWPEALALALLLFGWAPAFPGLPTMAALIGVLFLIGCVAHGALADSRPTGPGLTTFYLYIALGGWAGGAAVTLGAPTLFNGPWEYPVTVACLAALFVAHLGRRLLGWFAAAPRYQRLPRFGLLVLVLGLVALGLTTRLLGNHERVRSPYGTYVVLDEQTVGGQPVRKLFHGMTVHGSQLLSEGQQCRPTAYFHPGSPLATVFQQVPSPRRIGILGLGVGTMASYASAGDQVVFYEIDPADEELARRWFTYLDGCGTRPRIVIGDGRLSLATEAAEPPFDVLVMDAFSGDGVPVHLLTSEAVGGYRSRLAPSGLLAFNISNRYMDLAPVLVAVASAEGLSCLVSVSSGELEIPGVDLPSRWVVCAEDGSRLQHLPGDIWADPGSLDMPQPRVWSDDYVNLMGPLWWKATGR